ncbi:MAG: serine/threonine protein phosphatase [Lachnospiraceae bacterium]|nr:serine/threonine protein phosphatase [Lachnospiraceae bacterium]
MAIYVTSDIHGQYDMFMELLEKINLQEGDTLYILGDVLDRGPHPIKTLMKLMEMPNAVCLVGNHEVMAVECLELLMTKITEKNIKKLNETMVENLLTWMYNGARTTIDEFRALDREMRQSVLDFINEFQIYEEVSVGGKDYLLVHAGLGGFYPGKEMEEYSLDELIWSRAEYDIQYFEDIYVVTGHTPTQTIIGNPRPGYIFKGFNHIAIDCGCYRPDGRLAAICLDTGEEFYSSNNK